MNWRRLNQIPGRALLLGLFAYAGAGAMLLAGRDADVADATHQGTVQLYPPVGYIILGHKVTVPVRLTTCASTSSPYCRFGGYDVTMNYDEVKLSVVSDTSTSTGSNGSNTLNDTTATWKQNQWAGSQVQILSGPGVGSFRTILNNTATQLILSTNWTTVPTNGSTFRVGGITDGGWIGSTGRTVACGNSTYGSGWARKVCNTYGFSPNGPIGGGNVTAVSVVGDVKGIITFTQTQSNPDTPLVLTIEGYTIQADNLSGSRRVILCPDSSGDGLVGSADLSKTAQAFGKHLGDPLYTPAKDPIEDGVITSADLQATAAVFGARCIQQ